VRFKKGEKEVLQLFMECGPYIYPLILITLGVIYLIVSRIINLLSSGPVDPTRMEWGLNAILFWGAISAIIGFLGQCSGIYKGLSVIAQAEIVNPRLVVMGLKESLTTTLYGLTVLMISGIAWFVLSTIYRRKLGQM
jgi:MotA/TolQ/ExbB proton channel family